jgi:Zn-dependent M28 family amino/carboxypeptidase
LLFVATGTLGARERPLDALALLLGGGAVLAACARWLTRYGVLDLPFGRLLGNNLASTRGTPKLWLVAHLDSKSQPIPIGVRAAAIIASIALLSATAALLLVQLVIRTSSGPLVAVTMLGLIAALPVASSFVGARSHGALDNASGLATVLRIVELLPRNVEIGVMLTTAEELGLAGARAWAREASPASVINIDGIDDTGALRLVYSGRKPRALLDYLGEGWPAASRLPPGLLMDGVALADAGWEVVNVSKGSWRTVSRIHTSKDDLAHLDGNGIEEVAALVATSIIAQTSGERRL